MSFPTSRKKHYLQLSMPAHLSTSANFLSDLSCFNANKDDQCALDIFMANTERHASFVVQKRKNALKLLRLFKTQSVSCRGRQPVATLDASGGSFVICVSNVNTIIAERDFLVWVSSLKVQASDVVLHAPVISAPVSSCILSFKTIDAVLQCKEFIESSAFRGKHCLASKHWHVPRTRGVQSPSGPLHLRVPSVPAPPRRAAPAPPAQSPATPAQSSSRSPSHCGASMRSSQSCVDIDNVYVSEDDMFLAELQQADLFYDDSASPSVSASDEASSSSHAPDSYISSMHEHMAEQQARINELLCEQKRSQQLLAQNEAVLNRMRALNAVLMWDEAQLAAWVLSLNVLAKYGDYVTRCVVHSKMTGKKLVENRHALIDSLMYLSLQDKTYLLQHIDQLLPKARAPIY